MSDHHDEPTKKSRPAAFIDAFLSEAVLKFLCFMGACLLVCAIIVGSVAATFGVSVSTAITGIFALIVFAILAYSFLANTE